MRPTVLGHALNVSYVSAGYQLWDMTMVRNHKSRLQQEAAHSMSCTTGRSFRQDVYSGLSAPSSELRPMENSIS